MFQIDGATATVTHQQTVGDGSYSIAVNPVTNTVYLADGGGEIFSATPTNLQSYDVWVLDGADVSSGAPVTDSRLDDGFGVSRPANDPSLYSGGEPGHESDPTSATIATSGLMTVINGANNSLANLSAGATSSETGMTVNPGHERHLRRQLWRAASR